MNSREAKLQLKQLKQQVRSKKIQNDLLLFKLFVLLIFLAVIAAAMYGKIHIPNIHFFDF